MVEVPALVLRRVEQSTIEFIACICLCNADSLTDIAVYAGKRCNHDGCNESTQGNHDSGLCSVHSGGARATASTARKQKCKLIVDSFNQAQQNSKFTELKTPFAPGLSWDAYNDVTKVPVV
jgi:hypothetical protein